MEITRKSHKFIGPNERNMKRFLLLTIVAISTMLVGNNAALSAGSQNAAYDDRVCGHCRGAGSDAYWQAYYKDPNNPDPEGAHNAAVAAMKKCGASDLCIIDWEVDTTYP